MPFPISIRGSEPIRDEAANLSDAAIIIACVDQLEHEGARVAAHSDRSTSFTVPLLTMRSNWRFTAPLSGGAVEVIRDATGGRRLAYDFSTRRLALIGTLMIGALFFVVAVRDVGQFPWWFPFFGWLWLVGGNYFIAFVRASSWARRRITDAVKAAARAPAP